MSIKVKLVFFFLLVLVLSVGVITWNGLSFFLEDKEKYIYDIEAQQVRFLSTDLLDKISSYRRLLEVLADTTTYKFKNNKSYKRAVDSIKRHYAAFYFAGVYERKRGMKKFKYVMGIRKLKKIVPTQILDSLDINSLLKRKRDFLMQNSTLLVGRPSVAMVLRAGRDRIVVGILPADKLLAHSCGSKSIYTTFLVNWDGKLILHSDREKMAGKSDYASHPLISKYVGDMRIAATTMAYTKGGQKIISSISPVGDTGLWLVVEIPAAAAFSAAKALVRRSAYMVGAVFLFSLFLALFLSGRISRPLAALAAMTAKVSAGKFGVQLKLNRRDEIGRLVKAFNKMSVGLKEREAMIEEKNRQLVQSEKMSAFGQMSAGIAHEVKNPLAGILGYAQLAKRKVDPSNTAVIKNLEIIEKETKRCKEIIENLMRFARAEKTEMEDVDTERVVRDAVALVDHQITIAGMKIVRDFAPEGSLPKFWGNGNQIQQVLTNLMLNAQHAMDKGGVLTVKTRDAGDGFVEIIVSDTGHGIKKEHLDKIFEPFFTTKPAGKGTGLGLSVSYGIVRDHRGELKVESEVGVGTTFTVRLPTKKYLQEKGLIS